MIGAGGVLPKKNSLNFYMNWSKFQNWNKIFCLTTNSPTLNLSVSNTLINPTSGGWAFKAPPIEKLLSQLQFWSEWPQTSGLFLILYILLKNKKKWQKSQFSNEKMAPYNGGGLKAPHLKSIFNPPTCRVNIHMMSFS